QERYVRQQLLNIVKDKQRLALAQMTDDLLGGRWRAGEVEIQRVGDGCRDMGSRLDTGQRDEVRSVAKRAGGLLRRPDRQPRLADATRTDQGDVAAGWIVDERRDLLQLGVAAD